MTMMNIGQVAKASGVSAKMIRYYESVGLIATADRTEAGYRQYSENDLHTLGFIRRARDLGFSLERIKTLLGLWQDRSRQSAEVKKLAGSYIAELDEQIAKMMLIRQQLAHLAQACHGDTRPDCPILDQLSDQIGKDQTGCKNART
ncbi:Cu(I)-responsive transcriptional regulator [Undibacterium macrobrachii]|uniref:Cu(I)-responsive transcriptional regulator n=2 Tax=Undibacterium macrobrachii TaxID=1119058 RepID=A0ABQ2XGM7_9BURK|nr:Cu(I)-responsive transcriptional regulator [Undibacterium macrobrachii]